MKYKTSTHTLFSLLSTWLEHFGVFLLLVHELACMFCLFFPLCFVLSGARLSVVLLMFLIITDLPLFMVSTVVPQYLIYSSFIVNFCPFLVPRSKVSWLVFYNCPFSCRLASLARAMITLERLRVVPLIPWNYMITLNSSIVKHMSWLDGSFQTENLMSLTW